MKPFIKGKEKRKMQKAAQSHHLHRFTVGDVVIYVIIGLFTLACVIPFWYVIMSSFSQTPGFFIKNFTLDGYKYIFSTNTLMRSLGNTVYITVIGTVLKLLVTSMMAYALAETTVPGRKLLLNLVIFTMLFSGGMIPTYFIVRGTGLMNSLWSLIIPGLINPFNLIVMKNFFQGIPADIRESARIDGCHEMVLLFRIVLPLSTASLATFGLFYAVGLWNTYMSAMLYIPDNSKWPIQSLLRQIVYVSSSIGNEDAVDSEVALLASSIKMAVIIVATVPIICLYPFLQKHFAKGIMVGAVKG